MSPATLDLCIVLFLLLFTVAGAFSGALRQLIHLGATVAGWAAARWGAPWLAPQMLPAHPAAWQRGALTIGTFLVAAVLVGIVGGQVAKAMHGPSGKPGFLDRALGALLGGAKAGLAVWVALSVLALFRGPLVLGSLRLDVRRSDFGALAARHNLLEAAAPDLTGRLERLLKAARDPVARERLLKAEPGLHRLLEDPRVKAMLERGEGGPPDRGVEKLLSDPEVGALLEKVDGG
jgi:uncharacterized membrane protein required for colicin V production